MGLDMYLYKRMYTKNWNHTVKRKEVTVRVDGEEVEGFDNPSYIIQEIGYWRKFNALHGFIVDNFAQGNDTCKEIWLDYGDVKKILTALKDEENPIEPTEGPFFGSQERDEWYDTDVKNAIEVFESLLEEMESEFGREYLDYFYQSSW